MTIEIAREFARVSLEVRQAEEDLDALKRQREILGEQVSEFLAESGLGPLPFRDLGVTVYRETRIGAKTKEDVTPEEITRALVEHGLSAQVYAATRDAYVREAVNKRLAEIREEGGVAPTDLSELLPDDLRPLLDVVEVVRTKARKS